MLRRKVFVRILSLQMAISIVFTNFAFAQARVTKEETVYVNLTYEGKVKDITVSDWLHSDKNKIVIHDKSLLKDIINVKGDEIPEINGNNLTWKTDKGEIYYQGKIKKSLPLSVKISYSLNGKEIKPEELGGKTGKFKMTLEIINNEYHNVVINGKIKKIYTPFAVAAVINFPSDNCKNVKTNAGKVVNDGNKTVITYSAMPGLKDSLDINDEDFDDIFDLPERLELEADVEDFEMGDILIIASPEASVLEDIERSDSVIVDAKDGVKDLKDASDDVKAGIEDINYGVTEISDKFVEFNDGMYSLKHATKDLKSGSEEIFEGSKELVEGTDDLVRNVNILKDGLEALLDGAEKLADGTESAYDGASELKSGISELSYGIDQFNHELEVKLGDNEEKVGPLLEFSKEITLEDINGIKGLGKDSEAINEKGMKLIEADKKIGELQETLPNAIQTTVTNTANDAIVSEEVYGAVDKKVKDEIDELLSRESKLIKTVYKSVYSSDDRDKIIELIREGMESVGESAGTVAGAEIGNQLQERLPIALNQTLGPVNKEIESLRLTDEDKASMLKTLEKLNRMTYLTDKLHEEVLSNYQDEIAELIEQKKQEENKDKTIGMLFAENTAKKNAESKAMLSDALDKLSSGAKDLDTGAGKLKEGLKRLFDGSNDLKDGVKDLDDGVVQFKDGLVALNIGACELSEGLETLSYGHLKLGKGLEGLIDATDALDDAIVQIKDGLGDLYDGYNEFHEDGVKEIYDEVNKKTDDYDELFETRDQLITLAKRYNNFSGIEENMEGKVKFVMKINKIEAPEVEEQIQEVQEEEKGFIFWLKNIFKKIFEKIKELNIYLK